MFARFPWLNLHLPGVYQMGKVKARSWSAIFVPSGILMLKNSEKLFP